MTERAKRRPIAVVMREIRARLAAGEDLSAEVFPMVRSHDGLELDVRATVQGKKLILTDAAKDWEAIGPLVTAKARRDGGATIPCPCCRQVIRNADVWYSCRCFQGGGKPGCENCARDRSDQDAHIAATIREWGWDKNPSPGMLDYLTPGWRGHRVRTPVASCVGDSAADDDIPC
jgi:hypothetical protein